MTKRDGSTVDVRLDESYARLTSPPSGFGRRRQRAPARAGPALVQVEQHGVYRSGAPGDWVIARSVLRQFGELELEIGRALGIGPSGEQFHHLHLEGRDLLVRRVWIQSRQGCVGDLSPNADGTPEPSSQVLLPARRYTVHINTANGAAAGRLDRVGPIDRLSGAGPVVR